MNLAIQPIISSKRDDLTNGLWITHKYAHMRESDEAAGEIFITGCIEVQSYQMDIFRLALVDFEIHEGNEAKNDMNSAPSFPELTNFQLLICKGKKASKAFRNMNDCIILDMNANKRTAKRASLKNSVIYIPIEKDIGIMLINMRKVSILVLKCGHASEYEKSVCAVGDFQDSGLVLRMTQDIPSSEHSFNSNNKCVVVTELNLDLTPNLGVLDEYACMTKMLFGLLNKSDHEGISYDEFKLALEAVDVSCLEGRVMNLFKICDKNNSGSIHKTEFEIALMINDACPCNTSFLSPYEVFMTFDLDERMEVSLSQFIESIQVLTYRDPDVDLNMKKLERIFRKNNLANGRMDLPTFIRLWCMDISNVKLELKRRNILEDTSRSSIWQDLGGNRKLRQIFFEETIKEEVNGIVAFNKIRERVIEWRLKAQRMRDTQARENQLVIRRKNRVVNVKKSNLERRYKSLIEKEQIVKKQQVSKQFRETKYLASERDNLLQKRDSEKKKEREDKEELINSQIIQSGGDRLILSGRTLHDFTSLYQSDTNVSQVEIENVKILDLSKTSITHLPDLHILYRLISLRKLVLSKNFLSSLPPEISDLKNLEILLLDENEIEELPGEIGCLESLKIIDISVNKIKELSEGICSLPSLKVLKAHNNVISKISDEVINLVKLEVVDLSCNKIVSLPDTFAHLESMVNLDLSRNRLLYLPKEIGNMNRIEILNISRNHLKELPDSMHKLQKICILDLNENDITNLSDCMRGWNQLINLDCQCNDVNFISSKLGEMALLQRLCLTGNNLMLIPQEIGLLRSLIHLNFQSNQITVLPSEIGALLNLQSLDVSHNQLKMLPNEICLLKGLSWLNVSHNNLEILPSLLGSLYKLHTFKSSHNKLKELPLSFKNLQSLKELDISSNMMNQFPKELCLALLNLEIIYLTSNNIQFLPEEISEMKSLKKLHIEKNRLKAIPLSLIKLIRNECTSFDFHVRENPLDNLIPKYHSTISNQDQYQNPSGYSEEELVRWVEESNYYYGSAVEEWNRTKHQHLNGDSGVDDFMRRVMTRLGNNNEDNVLSREELMKRLKQFYFHCMKTTVPPQYASPGGSLVVDNENENIVTCKRLEQENKAAVAKDIHLKRQSAEDNLYFGNFTYRCQQAEEKILKSVELKDKMKRRTNDVLLEEIKNRVHIKNKESKREQDVNRIKLSDEIHNLNSISFERFKNPKRTLPVEIKPCWVDEEER